MEDETPITIQKPSFKLTKNSKGYTWEIKIYDEDLELMKTKITSLDLWANIKYGSERDITAKNERIETTKDLDPKEWHEEEAGVGLL